MKEIVIASHNLDKVREFNQIIQDPEIRFVSASQKGLTEPIPETGKTYQDNAEIKARAVFDQVGGLVLADDSGLSIDALDGFPGLYSARFAGELTGYPDKIKRLIELLEGTPESEWQAYFHCSIVFIDATGTSHHFEGEQRGRLIREARGTNGFGYDPVFFVPELGLTNAELTDSEKHERSHRGQALRAWYRFFKEQLKEERP